MSLKHLPGKLSHFKSYKNLHCVAGTAVHFRNINGCKKFSGSFQFIFILLPKMTKIIVKYRTYKPFCNTVCPCEVSCGQRILNIAVLRKVYFYRIYNLTQNKTFIMEFQYMGGQPSLFVMEICGKKLSISKQWQIRGHTWHMPPMGPNSFVLTYNFFKWSHMKLVSPYGKSWIHHWGSWHITYSKST